jgi:hypothetical protein
MTKLNLLLDRLEKSIPEFEKSNDAVSKSTVGWQIEHTLLTIKNITYALSKSNPADYKWSFKLPRLIVFTFGKIPRGKAKAPNVVLPSGNISVLSLREHLEITRKSIQILGGLERDKFFTHPYFGDLKLKQAIKMLEIHTKHHIDIINDIEK